MNNIKVIAFDNFSAQLAGIRADFFYYYKSKSLPKFHEGARLGVIVATVSKKDDKSIELWQRCGLREKNNAKHNRIIENGWEKINEFTPSIIEIQSSRIKYWTKKPLHKSALVDKDVLLVDENKVNYHVTGNQAIKILFEGYDLPAVEAPAQPEQPTENCPF